MKSLWIEERFQYDGTQLRSLYAYLEHGLMGDSIVAWQGPCLVTPDHMVDGEDLLAESQICGDSMVHFIVEKFDSTLFAAVGMQRLLASIVLETLRDMAFSSPLIKNLRRVGDDIYAGEGKFSISIATQSPVSSLIHMAVNVVNKGTPVPTVALSDFDLEPSQFGHRVLKAFGEEVDSMVEATQKVKWVK